MDKGYEILRLDRQDTPITGRRVTAYLLVPVGTTAAQARQLVRRFADDLRRDEDYQALWVGLYDRPGFLRSDKTSSAPLGHWIYAPHGQFADAHRARLGDYVPFEERDAIREKDLSKRPTDEQMELWVRCFNIADQFYETINLADPSHDPDERALELLAIETGADTEDVRRAVHAVARWTAE